MLNVRSARAVGDMYRRSRSPRGPLCITSVIYIMPAGAIRMRTLIYALNDAVEWSSSGAALEPRCRSPFLHSAAEYNVLASANHTDAETTYRGMGIKDQGVKRTPPWQHILPITSVVRVVQSVWCTLCLSVCPNNLSIIDDLRGYCLLYTSPSPRDS